MNTDSLPGFMACPACDGSGAICDGRRVPASYFQPAEYDSHDCGRCAATGEVLDPETAAVDLDLTIRLTGVVRKAARLSGNSMRRMSLAQAWEILMARSVARRTDTRTPAQSRRVRELVEDEGWSRTDARSLASSGF